jgi:hypothetical protein
MISICFINGVGSWINFKQAQKFIGPSQSPGKSEPENVSRPKPPRPGLGSEMEGSETKDSNLRPPRLMSETFETHVSEASETVEFETSESEALTSETLECRDRRLEFI